MGPASSRPSQLAQKAATLNTKTVSLAARDSVRHTKRNPYTQAWASAVFPTPDMRARPHPGEPAGFQVEAVVGWRRGEEKEGEALVVLQGDGSLWGFRPPPVTHWSRTSARLPDIYIYIYMCRITTSSVHSTKRERGGNVHCIHMLNVVARALARTLLRTMRLSARVALGPATQ